MHWKSSLVILQKKSLWTSFPHYLQTAFRLKSFVWFASAKYDDLVHHGGALGRRCARQPHAIAAGRGRCICTLHAVCTRDGQGQLHCPLLNLQVDGEVLQGAFVDVNRKHYFTQKRRNIWRSVHDIYLVQGPELKALHQWGAGPRTLNGAGMAAESG